MLNCYHGDSKPVDLSSADLLPVSLVLSVPWEMEPVGCEL